MTPLELFDRWFVQPVEKLRELPNGDGAFAALMIAIPLYERCIVGRLKLAGQSTKPEDVKKEMGVDLKLQDHERTIFWDMFRNGFMHHGMARGGKTKWLVSHTFGELPEFRDVNGQACVCFDPWKFTDRVLNAFRADQRLITASESFPLAGIFAMPSELLES